MVNDVSLRAPQSKTKITVDSPPEVTQSAQLQNRQILLHSLNTRFSKDEYITRNALQNPDLK
jgi:hypothetical protein